MHIFVVPCRREGGKNQVSVVGGGGAELRSQLQAVGKLIPGEQVEEEGLNLWQRVQ